MTTSDCEICPSPVNGRGVFATKDIKAGKMIMQEEALWVVDVETAIRSTFPLLGGSHQEVRENMIDAFQARFMRDGEVDPAHRDLLQLPGGFSGDDSVDGELSGDTVTFSETLREILLLNGVTELGKGSKDWAAIFKFSSRFNHSCAPNVVRTVHESDINGETTVVSENVLGKAARTAPN